MALRFFPTVISSTQFNSQWLRDVLKKTDAKAILSRHPAPEEKTSRHTALTFKVATDDLEMVEAICNTDFGKGDDGLLNRPGEFGRTPLETALERGNFPIFVALLNRDGIDTKPIQSHLPAIFQQAISECRAGRLDENLLVQFLQANVNFDLPPLSKADKLFIYHHLKLLHALIDRRPFSRKLLEDLDQDGNNVLTLAIKDERPDIALMMINHRPCRDAFLDCPVGGKVPLQWALDTYKFPALISAMIKQGARVSPAIYEKLIFFFNIKIKDLHQPSGLWRGCFDESKDGLFKSRVKSSRPPVEKKTAPLLEIKIPTENNPQDAFALWVSFAQAAPSTVTSPLLEESLLGALRESLARFSPGVIKDAHEKKITVLESNGTVKSYSILFLFQFIPQENWYLFLRIICPRSLAKLYFQSVPHMTKKFKETYINLVVPHTGFLLLKEFFQEKLKTLPLTQETKVELTIFCKIMRYLLAAHSSDVDTDYASYLRRFPKWPDSPDFFAILITINALPVTLLKQYARMVDLRIKKEMGALKTQYLKIMYELDRKALPKYLHVQSVPLTQVFAQAPRQILAQLNESADPQHTSFTYAVTTDNKPVFTAILQKIAEVKSTADREGLLESLNVEGMAERTPIEQALYCGNLPMLALLLNIDIVVKTRVLPDFPYIVAHAITECRAGRLAQEIVAQILKAQASLQGLHLHRADKLFLNQQQALISVVLDQKSPPLVALSNLDEAGNNILTKAIRDQKETIVALALKNDKVKKAFLEKKVSQFTPLEMAVFAKPPSYSLILMLLQAGAKITPAVYRALTNVFHYRLDDFHHYKALRDQCYESKEGQACWVAQSHEEQQQRILFDKLLAYCIPPKRSLLTESDFLQCAPGSIQDVHSKRIILNYMGEDVVHTLLYVFMQLPLSWHLPFLRLMEPRSLAKLYYQQSSTVISQYCFSELEKYPQKFVGFTEKVVSITGFFLLYEYFNQRLVQKFSPKNHEELSIFCEIIHYLKNTVPLADGPCRARINQLASGEMKKEFLQLINAINTLSSEALHHHAVEFDKYIGDIKQIGAFKLNYTTAMSALGTKNGIKNNLEGHFKPRSLRVNGA